MGNNYATEKALERDFVNWCKHLDIQCVKGPSMFAKGFPDRFWQLPKNGGTVYAEFKGTSYYGLTPMQKWWQRYLVASNPNRYFVIEDKAELEALKKHCIQLMEIGAKVVAYENKLLKELNSSVIIIP
jgi:hypothetical protein